MPAEKHREFNALQGSEPTNEQSGRTASRTGVDHLPLKEGIGTFPHRALSLSRRLSSKAYI